jgi:hypothetical protein
MEVIFPGKRRDLSELDDVIGQKTAPFIATANPT